MYRILSFFLIFLLCPMMLFAAPRQIIYPVPANFDDPRGIYTLELLAAILEQTRTTYGNYILMPSKKQFSSDFEDRQKLALKNGWDSRLSLIWKTTDKSLEHDFIPVRIPIYKGLLGYRVFLIDQKKQSEITLKMTLAQLKKKLVIGQGEHWIDVPILKNAGFSVKTEPKYDMLFSSLFQGRFNAFGRGIHEAVPELSTYQSQYPDLAIEKNYILYYPMPTYFFTSATDKGKALAQRIEAGFKHLIETGRFDRIFYSHFKPILNAINIKNRRIYTIPNPLLPEHTPLKQPDLWLKPENYGPAELKKVTLQMNGKHGFGFAGFYAAREKGFYRDAGLDVELIEDNAGSRPVQDVLEQKIQFGLWACDLVRQRLNGKPVILLANYFKQFDRVLITGPQIRTPSDLAGKKLAICPEVLDSAGFAQMFSLFGLDPRKDLKLYPQHQGMQRFIDHQVDAVSASMTRDLFLLNQSGIAYQILDPGNYGATAFDLNLFTSQAFAHASSDIVTGFTKACNKGWQYALAHPEEMTGLIQKQYNSPEKSRQALMHQARQTGRRMLAKVYPPGMVQGDRLLKLSEQLVQMGKADSMSNFPGFIYNLPAVRKKPQLISGSDAPQTPGMGSLKDGLLPGNIRHTINPLESDGILDHGALHKDQTLSILTKEEQAWLADNPIATIGQVDQYAPFSYLENGQFKGLEKDLLDLVSKKTGLLFHQTGLGSWSSVLSAFKSGQTDLIGSISYKKERESFTLFTKPYYKIPVSIYIRNDFGEYTGLDSLKFKKVGIYKDIFFKEELKALGNIEVIEYKSVEELTKALVYGSVDALIQTLSSINYQIKRNAYTNLMLVDEFNVPGIDKEDLGFGVSPDKPLLHTILQKGLDAVTQQEMAGLTNKWIGNMIPEAMPRPMSLTPEEKQWIQKHPVIKISNGAGWEPFDFTIGDQPCGYSIDLLNIITERLGVKFEYVNGASRSPLLEKFKTGELDLLHSMSGKSVPENPWRLSKPYCRLKTLFVTKKHHPRISQITQLKGKTIAMVEGGAIKHYVERHHPEIKILPVQDTSGMLDAVSKEDAYATIGYGALMRYHIRKYGYADLKICGWFKEMDQGDVTTYHFIARPDAPELISMLNKALDTVTPGERERLDIKWFGADKKSQDALDRRIQLTSAQRAYLKEKGMLRMSVMPDWLPYEGINKQGRHQGIGAGLIQLISERINTPVELIPTQGWGQSLANLRDRKCDILPMAMDVKSRRGTMNFTLPYITEPFVIATRLEELFIKDAKEIGERKVGLIEHFAFTERLHERYPELNIVTVENAVDGLTKVRRKELFGFIDAMPTIGFAMQKNSMVDLKIAGKLDLDLELSIATRNDEPILGIIMQKAIDGINDEEKRAIMNRWLSIRVEQGMDYTLLWKALACVGAAFAVIFLWMHRMAVMNRKIKLTNQHNVQLLELAESATKTKSEFLANMSHEIRTPMNAIIGLSELALKHETPPKVLDYLKKINAAADSLLGIINDILDFSKIEAGKLSLEAIAFNLDDILDHIENLISIKTEEKGIELLFDIEKNTPRHLIGDPLRLKQILTNLANNAVKFTHQGHIVIKMQCLALPSHDLSDTAKFRFCVEDTGIGMTREQIEKLFVSFSQADSSTTRKYGGSGLGLSICKRLVELMNGEIGVKSAPEQGSAFFFTAEFGLQTQIETPPFALPHDITNIRVLLVDDNETARIILSKMLTGFGYQVYHAASGREAIEKIDAATVNDNPFHLVLMDWKMPGMNGIETAGLIQQKAPGSNTPAILMVTAYDGDDIRQAATDAGIKAFLNKPVHASILFDTIMVAMGKDHDIKMHSVKPHTVEGMDLIRGAHVLVAEDNEINQQVSAEILENEGFRVTIVDNGRQAVEKVLGEPKAPGFDAVLMDLQMPEMDGYEATMHIRKKLDKTDLPIIALTAHALSSEYDNCIEAGMNDQMTKPIDTQKLFQVLVQWIKPGKRVLPEAKKTQTTVEMDISQLHVPGIDIRQGISRIGGNQLVYFKLLKDFSTGYADKAQEIQRAVDDDDAQVLQRIAHTMKSVAGNIGAIKLFDLACKLNDELKKSRPKDLEPLAEQFKTELKQVLAAVSSVKFPEDKKNVEKNDHEDGPALEFDPDKLNTLLSLLHALLAKGEDDDALACIAKIRKMPIRSDLTEKIDQIEEFIDDIEFEKAQKLLDKIVP